MRDLFSSRNWSTSPGGTAGQQRTLPCLQQQCEDAPPAKDQSRLEAILANQGSREQGPEKKWRRPPTPKTPKPNTNLTIFVSNLEHGAHVKQTRPDDLKPKEADMEGEKVGEVGVVWE